MHVIVTLWTWHHTKAQFNNTRLQKKSVLWETGFLNIGHNSLFNERWTISVTWTSRRRWGGGGGRCVRGRKLSRQISWSWGWCSSLYVKWMSQNGLLFAARDVNSIEMKFSSNLALTLVSSLFLDITQDNTNCHLRQLSFSLIFLLPTFTHWEFV